MSLPSYNKSNRKTYEAFQKLPKGNYVCKIIGAEEVKAKSGRAGVKIAFDIAEGEYKDFYTKQFEKSTKEGKKLSPDAVYWLTVPYSNCEGYVQDNWDTFWANVELSNNGLVFDGNNLNAFNGKTFGGFFRIEQTEYNGQIYEHTRLYRTCIAQDIRDGKATYVPKDKLLSPSPAASSDDFLGVPEDAPADLPF